MPGVIAAVGTKAGGCYLDSFGNAASDPVMPMPANGIVRIASMTKLVTSVAVMILVDDGLVDLDSPLSAYVPGFSQPEVLAHFDAEACSWATRPASREATIRELLSHSGGYGYWFLHESLRVASGPSPDLLHPPFLIADPGTGFAYSTSSDVVALLVESVSGLSLDAFFEARLFTPLGMVDTGYGLPVEQDRLVRVHRRSGAGFRELPLETEDHEVRGGGGLYSTAADYSRLLCCLLRGGELDAIRVLSESAVAAIGSNQIGSAWATSQRTALVDRSNDFVFLDGTQKFGFGAMVETRARPGGRPAGSWGWGGIFNTWYWVDPVHELTAILLLQMTPFASPVSIELLHEFETAVYREMS